MRKKKQTPEQNKPCSETNATGVAVKLTLPIVYFNYFAFYQPKLILCVFMY